MPPLRYNRDLRESFEAQRCSPVLCLLSTRIGLYDPERYQRRKGLILKIEKKNALLGVDINILL